MSDESGFTKRGEEIAILCRGAFAIESMVLVTSDDGDEEKDVEERIDVNATTMVTRVGACVGSLVDVLDFSPPALLVDTGEASGVVIIAIIKILRSRHRRRRHSP